MSASCFLCRKSSSSAVVLPFLPLNSREGCPCFCWNHISAFEPSLVRSLPKSGGALSRCLPLFLQMCSFLPHWLFPSNPNHVPVSRSSKPKQKTCSLTPRSLLAQDLLLPHLAEFLTRLAFLLRTLHVLLGPVGIQHLPRCATETPAVREATGLNMCSMLPSPPSLSWCSALSFCLSTLLWLP